LSTSEADGKTLLPPSLKDSRGQPSERNVPPAGIRKIKGAEGQTDISPGP